MILIQTGLYTFRIHIKSVPARYPPPRFPPYDYSGKRATEQWPASFFRSRLRFPVVISKSLAIVIDLCDSAIKHPFWLSLQEVLAIALPVFENPIQDPPTHRIPKPPSNKKKTKTLISRESSKVSLISPK